jgi:NAD(P)-dependent dehydrogenase (short-subunit alcohol dehydrogenase family)
MRTVFITGVSSGIGEGAARAFCAAGWAVFGTVRTSADASRLGEALGEGFMPIVCDVTDDAAIKAAAGTVSQALGSRRLDGLINNAGISIAGPLELMPASDFRKQIEVNLVGPFLVTQAFLPLLGTDPARVGKPGRIVNISSVGGRIGPPFISAYSASKHGLEGMSESLRREVRLFGIDVVIVGPGSVATPIWTKTGSPEESPYADSAYGPAILRFFTSMVREGLKGFLPEQIGRRLVSIMENPHPKTRYALVPGRLINWTIPTTLPPRWVDAALGRAFGLRPADLAKRPS